MGKSNKMTQGKRNREAAKKIKQQEKEMRRLQRKSQGPEPLSEMPGEDPDLVGIRPGPQPLPY